MCGDREAVLPGWTWKYGVMQGRVMPTSVEAIMRGLLSLAGVKGLQSRGR